MTNAQPSSRLTVLMFTDLIGSTRLKTELGTVAYAKLIVRHDELFRSIVRDVDGCEVRRNGTGRNGTGTHVDC